VRFGDYEMQVVEMRGRRVHRVFVQPDQTISHQNHEADVSTERDKP